MSFTGSHFLCDLARRPHHLAATKKVNMEVWDRFATVGAIVDDEAVAIHGEPLASGHSGGSEQQVAE